MLFLLPYRKFNGDNDGPVAATKKYGSWMRRLAADRSDDLPGRLADVSPRTHLSNLVDGEHPDAQHEDWYARYVVRAWGDCAQHLGL